MPLCNNHSCRKEFEKDGNNQKYCSKKCCTVACARRWRQKTAIPCPGCQKPTNASRCRACTLRLRCATSATTTLGRHYHSLKFLKHSPYQKYTQIRLLAKYHNRHLKGLPCQKCGYSKHTQFCHIKPVRSFLLTATIAEVNAEANLLILCPNCHWELDHGMLNSADAPPRKGSKQEHHGVSTCGITNPPGDPQMSLYVVGPHGGAAFPLTVGLPQIQIAENGKDVVLTSGSYSVIMFNGKDNNDAKAMLSQIVKAIDPAPVFIANLAGGTSTPPAPVAP